MPRATRPSTARVVRDHERRGSPPTSGGPRSASRSKWADSVSNSGQVQVSVISGDVVLIKTLLYTRVRVAELVAIRLVEVDLDACRIRITNGKGGKDRTVPFPPTFAETLALHVDARRKAGGDHLFESGWKKPYSTRGVRAMLARYAGAAGLPHNMPPHRLRHFLFTWLKTQGIDDALIQPYSGHATRQSLEIYSRVALADAQQAYDQTIGRFPV